MNIGFLLGGAALSVASITTAALFSDKSKRKEHEQISSLQIDKLSAVELSNCLNQCFWKCIQLSQRLNKLNLENVVEDDNLDFNFDDDGLFKKGLVKLGNGIKRVSRSFDVVELDEIKKDILRLYKAYLPIFKQANLILKKKGQQPFSLKAFIFKTDGFEVNNSLDNDNWACDVFDLTDRIHDSLNGVMDIADGMISLLTPEQQPRKDNTEADADSKPDTEDTTVAATECTQQEDTTTTNNVKITQSESSLDENKQGNSM